MNASRLKTFAVVIPMMLLMSAAITASADSLSGTLTVDNSFTLYLSSSPTTLGTEIASGDDWTSPVSFSGVALVPGTTYYLQVSAYNISNYAGLLGSFSLSGSSLDFANGSQSLGTDTTDWWVSTTGFGLANAAPVSEGVNGSSPYPWGNSPGIATGAQWIWGEQTNPDTGAETEYFETEITTTATPEPGTLLLIGTGLVGLAGMARRKFSAGGL